MWIAGLVVVPVVGFVVGTSVSSARCDGGDCDLSWLDGILWTVVSLMIYLCFFVFHAASPKRTRRE